jgi:hypothetical protein
VLPLVFVLLLSFASLANAASPSAAQGRAPAKANLLGVSGNAFPWEPHWTDFQRQLAETNVGWVRLELRWDQIQPSPSEWRWDGYDQVVNDYIAQDVQVLGLLAYSVGWASGQGGSGATFGPPQDMDAWEAYVRATVHRYKDRVHNWEIWNEPDVAFFWNGQDGGDPATYLEMLKRAHRAIKAEDPQAVVMNGGLTGTERGARYMSTLLDMGAGQYLDALGFHGYVSDDGLDTDIYPNHIWPMIRQVRERAGKPIWFTEFGWASGCSWGSSACSEEVQANRIARNLPMLFSIGGVAHVFLFQFKDPGDIPDYFGITRSDATKKHAFTTYATMAAHLAGTAFEQRIDRGDPGIWDMRFIGPDRTVDIVWSNSGERDIWFETGSGTLRTWDINGNRQDIDTSGGGANLHLTINPIIVERDGQEPVASRCQYFEVTGHTICGRFLDYWNRYGGLSIFGYPLSPLMWENGKMVQYLERMKFEYQPEAEGTDWAVVGELVGRTLTGSRMTEQPFAAGAGPQNRDGCATFNETGHTLCGGFRGYWEANGGLWMFGYPISEEFQEQNWDTGQTYTVQYFERARFEWHPDNAGTPYEVLLGRLSAQLYAERYGQ